ncbi:hypothetical protein OsJ_01962 [Oryza sativa Japonica Group]|uniref:Uncharacterized protein n=2 Tax=Oryza sativa subsp. japonica TaxID=39947 RepID=A2ZTN2_ORYSJ|nr:hypothetical protein OsJ_01962 [Oryza sativa Japonica Group]
MGGVLDDEHMIKKFLRVVPKRYKQVAVALEQFLDLKTMPIEELVGRLSTAERDDNVDDDDDAPRGNRLYLTEEECLARMKLKDHDGSSSGSKSGGGGEKSRHDKPCSGGRGDRGHDNKSGGGSSSTRTWDRSKVRIHFVFFLSINSSLMCSSVGMAWHWKRLYDMGARRVLVMGTGPLGCAPHVMRAAELFNPQLSRALQELAGEPVPVEEHVAERRGGGKVSQERTSERIEVEAERVQRRQIVVAAEDDADAAMATADTASPRAFRQIERDERAVVVWQRGTRHAPWKCGRGQP